MNKAHSVHGRWGACACAFLGAAAIAACSAGDGSSLGKKGGGGETSSTGDGGIGFNTSMGAGANLLQEEPPCDNTPLDADGDGDGWTPAQGDCNDCTKQMNPGALDYLGNSIDDDCNGTDDDDPQGCDGALAIDSSDAMDGARAMGICKVATADRYGLVSAEYITPDGGTQASPNFALGHGILTGFGAVVKPQEGAKLFAVSSGTARQPTDPGYQSVGGFDKQYTTAHAPGFPKESPACPGVVTGEAHDSIALRMKLRTPTNALSLAFNVNMYTYEFPVFICDVYNDFVTAIMAPAPSGLGDATCGGVSCGNISFDTQGNPISVNNAFLEVCTPQNAGGKDFPCVLGPDQLNGTDFEEHAATGWLQTTAPIEDAGGEITIEFGAWDSGDGILDTTGLFDNFVFSYEETPTGTTPVEDPK